MALLGNREEACVLELSKAVSRRGEGREVTGDTAHRASDLRENVGFYPAGDGRVLSRRGTCPDPGTQMAEMLRLQWLNGRR